MTTTARPLPLAAALLALGCLRPMEPPVAHCTPLSQRCGPSGAPEVCSASERWHRAGDLPSCGRVGGVCSVSDAGVAHCAPRPEVFRGAAAENTADSSADGPEVFRADDPPEPPQ